MLRKINLEIATLQEGYTHPDSISKKLAATKKLLEDARYELRTLERICEKENLDVENINKTNLTTLFYKCLGTHDKHVDKEEQEALAAQLKYEACKMRVEELTSTLSKFTKQHYEMSKVQEKMDALRQQKRQVIENSNIAESRMIEKLEQQIEAIKREMKELKEAISPGKAAASTLHEAMGLLESAGNWGTFDLFGGGLVADVMKHSKIDEAKKCIMQAQNYLQRLQIELQDVDMTLDKSIQVTEGAVLADFFFDGLIADWYMQSKISQSRENITGIYGKVLHIVNALSKQLESKEQSLKAKEIEIQRLIEEA